MKRIENEEMKEHILDAVAVCKVKAAGEEVSLTQISSQAGISERTLNRYYPDKELLIYEAAVKYMRKRYEAFADIYHETDHYGMSALDRLISLIQLQAEYYQADTNMAKVFVRAFTTALRTAVYRNLPHTGYDASCRQIVIDCIEQGIKDGSMREDLVPMDVYILISSNFNGLVQRLIHMYSVCFTEEAYKRELSIVFQKYIAMVQEYLSAKGRQM